MVPLFAAARAHPAAEVAPVTGLARPRLALVPVRAAVAEAPVARDKTGVGIAALFLSTVLFPLSDMLSKTLGESHSGLQIAWIRYATLLLLVGPSILCRPGLLRTARPLVQLVRGLSSAAATSLALVGFMFLPVADATAIGFCAPLIVTGLAALVLKERVGWGRWAAAAVGFAGILVIVQPSPGTFQVATLLPLASSLFSAATVVATRVVRSDRIETTVVLSALVGFVVMSVAVVPVWKPLDLQTVELGLLMGVLAAAASILQVVAYRCAPSSLLAPFSYAQILWAMGIGWLVIGTLPGPAMLAGSAIVILSGCAAAIQAAVPPRRGWVALRGELLRLDPAQRTRAA